MKMICYSPKQRELTKVADFQTIEPIKKEVLKSEKQIANRAYQLQKAVLFGTRYNIKTEVKVKTKNDIVNVVSLIYKIDEKFIAIKGNVFIPIRSILSVRYIY